MGGYIVTDNNGTIWGAGWTRQSAIQDGARHSCTEDYVADERHAGDQNVSIDQQRKATREALRYVSDMQMVPVQIGGWCNHLQVIPATGTLVAYARGCGACSWGMDVHGAYLTDGPDAGW